MTRWLDTDEQRMWRAFITMSSRLMEQLGTELQQEHDIPMPSYEILVRLSEAPDRVLRMSELAEHSMHSRSRLSHTVSRLEELGWVQRTTCPTDKRGSFALLTDKGFSILKEAAPTHVEGVRKRLFDPLSKTEVAQLRKISEKILSHLETINTDL